MKNDAVSDVLGSILLVGMTVAMMASLSIMVLNFPGPPNELHADLQTSLSPGTGGWNSGDEQILLQHRGGEAVPAAGTKIIITINGVPEIYEGAGLDQGFSDGKFSIGEKWLQDRALADDVQVRVQVVVTSGQHSKLILDAALGASSGTLNPCAAETVPPSVVSWTQNPEPLGSTHVGSVTVAVTLSDDCSGVDQNIHPNFYYRVNPGTPPAWTTFGTMTLSGTNQWTATIPDLIWANHGGKSLEYFIDDAYDVNGNKLTSAVDSNPITLVDPCIGETTPPTVAVWGQSPGDVTSLTSGSVIVDARLTDNCSGPDDTVTPHLFWRIGAASFADAGPMTLTAVNSWQGTIPAQTWGLFVGQNLDYYISGMTDLNGNSGDSIVKSDQIQLELVYTYVDTNTPARGTVMNFANMKSGTDSGASGTITEVAQSGGSSNTISINSNSIINAGGWSNAAGVFAAGGGVASDTSGSGGTIHAGVTDPAPGGTITKVELKASWYATGTNGRIRLQHCQPSCVQSPTGYGPNLVLATNTWDITSTQAPWTWAKINALDMAVSGYKDAGGPNPDFHVDHMYVVVTYTASTFDGNVQFDFADAPATPSPLLQLRYQVAQDTFRVEVYDFNTGLWSQRGGILTATSMTSWDYALQPTEFNNGAPRIRIIDQTPLGTSQGTLNLDYLRVLSQ